MGWESVNPNAYNNAMSNAYNWSQGAPGAAAQLAASGQRVGVVDPLEALLNKYDQSWQMGGGGGGYDNRQAVRDQYNTMRNSATTGRDETRTRLEDLYAQLAQSYAGQADQTKQRYGDAIAASQAGSNQLIGDTRARIDQEAAQRNAMYAQMGIGGGDPFSQSQAQAERGIGDIGNTAANWNGLMGAQQQAQMTRDNQSYLGAKDQGTISLDDMQRRYDAYNRQLDAQEQQALMGAYQPGSGGSMVNTSGMSPALYEKLQEQYLINNHYLPGQQDPNESAFDLWKRKYDYSHPNGTSGTTPPNFN